jgi:hypothetical protein
MASKAGDGGAITIRLTEADEERDISALRESLKKGNFSEWPNEAGVSASLTRTAVYLRLTGMTI